MHVDALGCWLFFLAAAVLLGSPGPGIAALVAIGREKGLVGGLPFFWGLQAGLALSAATCAAGLFSLVRAVPALVFASSLVAVSYLVFLAYRIASAPVGGGDGAGRAVPATARGGLVLGMTNPKAYLGFVSLMASYAVVRGNAVADVTLKWLICVGIMVLVDVAWLWLGSVLGRIGLSPGAERALNLAMAAAIIGTAAASLGSLLLAS